MHQMAPYGLILMKNLLLVALVAIQCQMPLAHQKVLF
jgi:hypothetical protein